MAAPRPAVPALLVVAAFSRHAEALAAARRGWNGSFGPVALTSEPFAFDQTAYYEPTMGAACASSSGVPRPRRPDCLPEVKQHTNALEASRRERGVCRGPAAEPRPRLARAGQVPAGDDQGPGASRLPARRHLRRGDAALPGGAFGPWPWTYADYREPAVLAFLEEARTSTAAGSPLPEGVTIRYPERGGRWRPRKRILALKESPATSNHNRARRAVTSAVTLPAAAELPPAGAGPPGPAAAPVPHHRPRRPAAGLGRGRGPRLRLLRHVRPRDHPPDHPRRGRVGRVAARDGQPAIYLGPVDYALLAMSLLLAVGVGGLGSRLAPCSRAGSGSALGLLLVLVRQLAVRPEDKQGILCVLLASAVGLTAQGTYQVDPRHPRRDPGVRARRRTWNSWVRGEAAQRGVNPSAYEVHATQPICSKNFPRSTGRTSTPRAWPAILVLGVPATSSAPLAQRARRRQPPGRRSRWGRAS